MTFEVVQASSSLGAEVRGLDLNRPLDEPTRAALRQAWLAHLVLLFRDQSLSDADLVRFSGYFGECDKAPPNEAALETKGFAPEMPEVAIISNVVVDGVEIGSLGAGECAWHTDMSYNPEPAMASALYAVEVPDDGGETSFLDMYVAYESLPGDLKDALQGKKAIHDATYTSAGGLRKGVTPPADVSQAPGAHHPILRTHPETGRTALFLGRRTNAYIPGLSIPESEALLDAVWTHTDQDRFVWTHEWQRGDLLLWDNRCVMHRREEFDPNDRRVMHRTQLKGDVPYHAG